MRTVFSRLLRRIAYRRTFIQVMQECIHTELSANVTPGTIIKYRQKLENYQAFAKANDLLHLQPSKIHVDHAELFYQWLLRNLTSCSHQHAAAHLNFLKRVSQYAASRGLIKQDQLEDLRPWVLQRAKTDIHLQCLR